MMGPARQDSATKGEGVLVGAASRLALDGIKQSPART
jgi:hypothetical protein